MSTHTIVLMRHGPAEEREAWAGKPDSERPLTPEGEKRVRKIARAMDRLGLEIARIWSSSYERALETAKLVREHGAYDVPLEVSSVLTPEQDPGAALDKLLPEDAEGCSLWVGHEPNLSLVIERVAFRGRASGSFSLRKGGLCCLEVVKEKGRVSGELRWLLTPKLLVRIGDA